MIAVETVIRKLVSEFEFVILPGFGALLSHQVPAIYDQDSGVFAPPVKKLAFNEFLKLDDGLLANFISREEKITHADAVSYVKRYTDILRSELKSQGKAQIEGIGEFQMNVEGKLLFEPNTEKYFKDEWFGFKSIPAKTFENYKTSDISVSKIDVEEKKDVKVAELIEDRKLKVNWVRWASAAMLAGVMFYVSFFLVSSNNENIKSTLNPFADLFGQKYSAEKATKKADAVKPVAVPVQEVKTADPEIVKTDSIMFSPSTVVEVVKDPSVNTIASADTNQNFYLIAGAFKGMKQATVLLKEIQAKGYGKAIIISSDKYSKMYKVAVQGFEEEKDAYHASARLKSVIGEEGWVFKKR